MEFQARSFILLLLIFSAKALESCDDGYEPYAAGLLDVDYNGHSYSSVWNNNDVGTANGRGRLDSAQAWTAGVSDANQWMLLDLGLPRTVQGVATKGRHYDVDPVFPSGQMVTTYTVQVSLDEINWTNVDGGTIFNGNTDQSTLVSNYFATEQTARYVRIHPVSWQAHISMRAGVILGADCANVDECSELTHDCSPTATCSDSDGSFTCHCNSGFDSDDDGLTCSNVDECSTGEHDCDGHASCADIDGSFTCTCNSGFDSDNNGVTCNNVDECTLDQHNCEANATCADTDGSFICTCADQNMTDWAGDGTGCEEDQCKTGNHDCSTNAECEDTDGSYSCACYIGYEDQSGGIGTICENLDECSTGAHDCDEDATCLDTDGSFTCSCNAGFIDFSIAGQATPGTMCEEDECITGNHNCDPIERCMKLPLGEGGYLCLQVPTTPPAQTPPGSPPGSPPEAPETPSVSSPQTPPVLAPPTSMPAPQTPAQTPPGSPPASPPETSMPAPQTPAQTPPGSPPGSPPETPSASSPQTPPVLAPPTSTLPAPQTPSLPAPQTPPPEPLPEPLPPSPPAPLPQTSPASAPETSPSPGEETPSESTSEPSTTTPGPSCVSTLQMLPVADGDLFNPRRGKELWEGHSGSMTVLGRMTHNMAVALVQFDSGSIPSHANIVSAYLRLDQQKDLSDPGSCSANRLRIIAGQGNVSDEHFTVWSPFRPRVVKSYRITAHENNLDVTRVLQSAFEADSSQLSLLLEGSSARCGSMFASKESTTELPPLLTVTYDSCAPPSRRSVHPDAPVLEDGFAVDDSELHDAPENIAAAPHQHRETQTMRGQDSEDPGAVPPAHYRSSKDEAARA